MSSRARKAKSAGPGSLPPPSSAATPGRRLPRASLAAAISHSSSPRLAANLPRTPRASAGAGWRSSLMTAPDDATVELAKRQSHVAGPARAAFDELVSVGKDGEGGYGAMRLTAEAGSTYAAFEACKRAFLSPATFLSASELAKKNPAAVADPSSPLSNLIKIANLTTFLYLLFSAAPNPDGSRPRDALNKLREAANAFLKFVVPVDSQLHDGALRMLVGLNCQAYLSASAHARNSPPDATEFFGHQLSSYFPMGPTSTSRDPLANRGSSIIFNQLNSSAISLVDKVGGDLAVLETQWKWDHLALELRNYCEAIARSIDGTLAASQELLVAGMSESEPEVVSRAPLSSAKSKGKGRAVDLEDEEISPDEESDAPASDQEQDGGEVYEQEQEIVEEYEEGDLEPDEGQEADDDGEETSSSKQHDEDDEQQLESATETSDSEEEEQVAAALGAASPRALRQTMSVSVGPSSPVKSAFDPRQESIEPETYIVNTSARASRAMLAALALSESSQSQSSSEDGEEDADTTMRAPNGGQLGEESDGEAHPESLPTQQANNVSKFKAVLMEDASSADETSADELATQAPRPHAALAHLQALNMLSDAETDEEEADELQGDGQATVESTEAAAPAKLKVGFTKDNRLVRRPDVPRAGPSMLERQADAERLTFNSQGDDSPAPAAKKKRGRPPKIVEEPPFSSASTSTAATKSRTKRKSVIAVEIPVARTTRRTRSASADLRPPSAAPAPARLRKVKGKSNALEVPVEVGRSSRATTRTKSPAQQPPIEEELEEQEPAATAGRYGLFETGEAFEINAADFHGDGDGQQEPLEAQFDEEEREEGQEFELDVDQDEKRAPRTSKKDKGKAKALFQPEEDQLDSDLDSNDDEVARYAQYAHDLLLATQLQAEATASPHPASSPRRSRSPAVAGPSNGRSSAKRPSSAKQRNRVEPEGPAFQTDSESEDEQLVAANRKRKRRRTEQERDEAHTFPDTPRRNKKSGRRRVEDEDDVEEYPEAGRRKAERSKRRKSEEVRRKRRHRSYSSSDDSSADDSDDRRRKRNYRYFTGRNVTGRLEWTALETTTLLETMAELGSNYRGIITLHGRNGSKSHILKHRNNVACKDKAVNLKVQMIKDGRRVPHYLKDVTISRVKWGKAGPPAGYRGHYEGIPYEDKKKREGSGEEAGAEEGGGDDGQEENGD